MRASTAAGSSLASASAAAAPAPDDTPGPSHGAPSQRGSLTWRLAPALPPRSEPAAEKASERRASKGEHEKAAAVGRPLGARSSLGAHQAATVLQALQRGKSGRQLVKRESDVSAGAIGTPSRAVAPPALPAGVPTPPSAASVARRRLQAAAWAAHRVMPHGVPTLAPATAAPAVAAAAPAAAAVAPHPWEGIRRAPLPPGGKAPATVGCRRTLKHAAYASYDAA
jgi:hypothetical protein